MKEFFIITLVCIVMSIIGFYVGRYLWKYKGAMRADDGEVVGHYYDKGKDRFYALFFFGFIPMSIFMWFSTILS